MDPGHLSAANGGMAEQRKNTINAQLFVARRSAYHSERLGPDVIMTVLKAIHQPSSR